MKTLKEFQAEAKKAENVLNQLIKKGVEQSVIKAQQQSVDKAKAELEAAENTPIEKAIQADVTNDSITFCVVKDGKIEKINKKIAFVKHNRPIDTKRVDKFINLIAQGKYEEAYPIIVAEAEKLIENDYTIVDANGNEISENEAAGYYVILDGQHRGTAFAKLAAVDEVLEIPNVHIRNKEHIGEYLIDINDAAKSWDSKDKYAVAGLTTEEEVFVTISEKIGEGFNPSTVAKIYLGKALPSTALNCALKGEKIKLPKGAEFNKDRGDKFITLCKSVEMDVALITKRYYIEGFNSYAAATNDERVFGALKELNKLKDSLKMIKAVKNGDEFVTLLKEAAAA